ncbi:MAG: RNA polymerase sigma factor [Oligoflexales bacterium]|nr:RNA polymerase sigma factor [Oligoflexales bacterium]
MKYSQDELNNYYRYALALTNHSNDAYDLVHDALIKVEGRMLFKRQAYIKMVIRNHYFDTLRKGSKNEYVESVPEEASLELESILVDQMEVASLLEKVTPEERELIYLIEIEGQTYKEVSKLLQVSQGTLLSKLHRAKKKLKQWSKKNETAS